MSVIKKLQESRNHNWEEAKKLNDLAVSENRDFTGEEQAQWDKLNNSMNDLDKRIKEITALEENAKETEGIVERYASAPKEEASAPVEKSALRKLADGEIKEHRFTREQRDLTSSNAGGVVPQSFYDQITAVMESIGPLRTLGTVVETSSGEDVKFPTLTANSAAALVAEGGTIGESDATISSFTLGSYKLAFLTQLSQELLRDSGVNLEAVLAEQAGIALQKKMNQYFIEGTGSSQPKGLENVSTVKTLAATGAITIDEIFDAIYGMGQAYRNDPSFAMMFSGNTINEIRQLKDSNNQYLWSPAVQAGQPDRLAGVPVYEDANIDDMGASAKMGYVGAFKRFYIRQVNGIDIARSDDFAFSAGLVSYRMQVSFDCSPDADSSAIKKIVNAAS